MNADQRDFHVEEFRQIKAEISTLLERVASLFKYGLIGSAAIYAWFLTRLAEPTFQKMPELFLYASLIPPMMVFFFGVLAMVTYKQVDEMGGYLQKVEQALGNVALGWETYMRRREGVLLPTLLIFYVVLLAAEIGIAFWVRYKF
jgi:FtsH-binding integral membrane protein